LEKKSDGSVDSVYWLWVWAYY